MNNHPASSMTQVLKHFFRRGWQKFGTEWFIFQNYGYVFKNLKPGDIAIDCGANIGDVTAKMAKEGVTVYAFEPHPVVFQKIQDRFRSNPNVHCIQKGVWDKNATVDFYLHKNSQEDPVKWSVAFSLLKYKGNVDDKHPVQVPVIDLTEFITQLDKPIAVLKIDVEGVEFEILEKLIETGLVSKIKTILVESHEKRIQQLQPAAEKLRRIIKQKNIHNIFLDWN